MVISRPSGAADVGFQMIARPLLERLEAVRGRVDLVVLRPPTPEALAGTLAASADAGEPFQVVHFDRHGALAGRRAAGSGMTQIYLHAHMALKERALARTTPAHATPGRYQAPDALLAFPEGL